MRLNSSLLLLGGIGVGAGLMYLLDPDRGSERRNVIRDKALSTANGVGEAVTSTSRDIANRAGDIMHAAGSITSGITDRASNLIGGKKEQQPSITENRQIQPQAH